MTDAGTTELVHRLIGAVGVQDIIIGEFLALQLVNGSRVLREYSAQLWCGFSPNAAHLFYSVSLRTTRQILLRAQRRCRRQVLQATGELPEDSRIVGGRMRESFNRQLFFSSSGRRPYRPPWPLSRLVIRRAGQDGHIPVIFSRRAQQSHAADIYVLYQFSDQARPLFAIGFDTAPTQVLVFWPFRERAQVHHYQVYGLYAVPNTASRARGRRACRVSPPCTIDW